MKLRKAELKAQAERLEQGAETPEVLAEELNELHWQQLAERSFFAGVGITCGQPQFFGIYSTKGQVEKAAAKFAIFDKAYAIPGYTAEGFALKMAELDRALEPPEVEDGGKDFWARAFAIKDGKETGFVGSEIVKVQHLRDLESERG